MSLEDWQTPINRVSGYGDNSDEQSGRQNQGRAPIKYGGKESQVAEQSTRLCWLRCVEHRPRAWESVELMFVNGKVRQG